jgi:hypothetical protein
LIEAAVAGAANATPELAMTANAKKMAASLPLIPMR